jgi:hypothetical protein
MSRKYRGKYPNAVRWIASTNAGGYTIRTNAGAFLRYATPHDMRAAFGPLELDDIAKLRDVSPQLHAQGITTHEDLEARANAEARSMSLAPRFARGDVCAVITSRGDIPAVVVEITYPSAAAVYVLRDACGNEFKAAARAVFPCREWIVSPTAIAAHGTRAQWRISAQEMRTLLGVSKLPVGAMHGRWIQGHFVYVISAQEARDIGSTHRVRTICSDCAAHVPFGRMHQHKCK